LKTIKHFDVVVGQEIEVKNAFYNTHGEEKQDIRKEYEAGLIQGDSIDVYELMGSLMEAADQEAIDYLLELVMRTDPIDKVDFDENNQNLQSATRVYYYDESDSSKFESKMVDGKEILSLPTMFVTKAAEEQKNKPKTAIKSYDPSVLNKHVKVYFDAGKSDLDPKYLKDLDGLLTLLTKYNELGIEISGYASAEGDEEFNKSLSNRRAISVLNYLNTKGVVRRRIVAKGYGSTQNQSGSKEEARRVEIRIIDLTESK
jgi:outer membrane protein OmpA-like peptidoglycan-associated protein